MAQQKYVDSIHLLNKPTDISISPPPVHIAAAVPMALLNSPMTGNPVPEDDPLPPLRAHLHGITRGVQNHLTRINVEGEQLLRESGRMDCEDQSQALCQQLDASCEQTRHHLARVNAARRDQNAQRLAPFHGLPDPRDRVQDVDQPGPWGWEDEVYQHGEYIPEEWEFDLRAWSPPFEDLANEIMMPL